jgi:hypothetical protein
MSQPHRRGVGASLAFTLSLCLVLWPAPRLPGSWSTQSGGEEPVPPTVGHNASDCGSARARHWGSLPAIAATVLEVH